MSKAGGVGGPRGVGDKGAFKAGKKGPVPHTGDYEESPRKKYVLAEMLEEVFEKVANLFSWDEDDESESKKGDGSADKDRHLRNRIEGLDKEDPEA